jgi:prephenate dehydrogenase
VEESFSSLLQLDSSPTVLRFLRESNGTKTAVLNTLFLVEKPRASPSICNPVEHDAKWAKTEHHEYLISYKALHAIL